jgi:hypothetical protein
LAQYNILGKKRLAQSPDQPNISERTLFRPVSGSDIQAKRISLQYLAQVFPESEQGEN